MKSGFCLISRHENVFRLTGYPAYFISGPSLGGEASVHRVMPTPGRRQQGDNPENTVAAAARDTDATFFPKESPQEDTVHMAALKGPPVPEGN